MMSRKSPWLAGAVALALLAGCQSDAEKAASAAGCPKAVRVQDASALTRFRAGPGRDPTDMLVQAEIGELQLVCASKRDRVDVDLVLQIAAVEGPALARTGTERTAKIDYFVAIVAPGNRIVAREVFSADFRFVGNRTRLISKEELAQRIPLAQPGAGAGYQVAVGFVMSRDEVDFNRRAGRR